MDIRPNHNIEEKEEASEDQEDHTAPTTSLSVTLENHLIQIVRSEMITL